MINFSVLLPRKSTGLATIQMLLIVSLGLFQATSYAAEEMTAHQVAEQVKNDLVSVIRSKEALEKEGGEEKYISSVKGVLEPVVDFNYISRGVMGKQHFGAASADQKKRFATKFKQGLVSTYAKGLASFADYEITVAPPGEGFDPEARRANVVLVAKGGDSVNRLAFSMGKNAAGEWKVINMHLNGVDFGRVLNTQFGMSMKKNENNIDKVIDEWAV
ncbi:MlaC/ttg2D family ABC transporter substrate-binding protein [Aurantivibrio infirmus]